MMAKKAGLLTLILASFLFLPAIIYQTEAQSVEDISKSLMCPCGCGKILSECYCDTAAQLKSQIEQKISEGKTKEQIIADFRAVYTDEILVTPAKSGLELTLWTFPIIASVVGTVAIYQLARRKSSIPDSEVKAPISETEEEEPIEKEREEMRKYEEIFDQEYQKFKKDQEQKSDD